jgi:hypothetical protein
MTIFYVTNSNQFGAGSIEEAIASAASDDIINIQVATVLISSEIVIPQDLKNLTIQADRNGLSASFSGQNSTRIMLINRSNITLNNIRFIFARSSSDGGAIHLLAFSSLFLNGCDFFHNVSETVAGAIFARHKCKIVADNCRVYHNECISGLSDVMSEGGFPPEGRAAGGVAVLTSSSQVWKNSIFLNNQGWAGGAINSLLSELLLEDCIFKDNNSLVGGLDFSSGAAFAAGGAVYTDGASDKNLDNFGSIIFRRCRFENNQGGANGGAASLYGYRPKNPSSSTIGDLIIVEDSLFLSNRCFALNDASKSSLGGAIRIGGDTPEALILRSSFINNTSESQGGAIAIDHQPDIVKLHNCTIFGNIASTYSKIGGGIITETFCEVRHCTIANNWANQGSAIQVTNRGGCDIRNSILYDNSRLADGSFLRQVRPDLGFVGSNNIQYPDGGWQLYFGVDSRNPQLGELTNDGDVYYLPLLADSPAISAGNPSFSDGLDILQQERGEFTDIGSVNKPLVAPHFIIMQDDIAYTGLYVI